MLWLVTNSDIAAGVGDIRQSVAVLSYPRLGWLTPGQTEHVSEAHALTLLLTPVIPPLIPGVAAVLVLTSVTGERGLLANTGIGCTLHCGTNHDLTAFVFWIWLQLTRLINIVCDDLAPGFTRYFSVVAGALVVASIKPGLSRLICRVLCDTRSFWNIIRFVQVC